MSKLLKVTSVVALSTWSLSAFAGIIGHIDSVTEQDISGAVLVSGWACDQGQAQSISVHLYAGGAAGAPGASFVAAAQANLPSEAAVSQNCRTSGVPHRFVVNVGRSSALKFSKKSVFIHGISVSKQANLKIANSGTFKIPSEHKIIGNIDAVMERADGAILVRGWAYDTYENKSISIHIYANAPAGGSTARYVQAASANLNSEAAVSQACDTQGVPHRFEAVISRHKALSFSKAPLFVHGISVSGGANITINGSGKFSMPEFPAYQNLSQLMKDPSGNPFKGDLTIPAGYRIKLDQSINVRSLTVEGRLYCPVTGDFTIQAASIHVMGSDGVLECGTSLSPFQGHLTISVTPGVRLTNCDGVLVPCSDRNIMAMNGGTIRLVGNKKNVKWLKLVKTVQPGDTVLELSENVSWQPGELVAIAPTGFKFDEAEDILVKSVSGNRVTLAAPLKYRHNGETSTYRLPHKTWVVDERAEVANLSRNIKVTSYGNPENMDYRGAHMMVMFGAFGYIDGVEFSHMGRMGEMGRYPFHWHRAGDVSGQYIKNSSIHHSFQRCITVHGTNNALVEDNVCYDHYGHGFFLEDGDEVGNTFAGNLGILSRLPLQDRHLLQSDIDRSSPERFPGPSTFWVSNPDNTFVGNVSAGSQGTGFWMSFSNGLSCTQKRCVLPDNQNAANIIPRRQNTRRFDNNTARTNMVGFTWDGLGEGSLTNNPRNPHDRAIKTVHYSPATTPEILNMKAFKSRNSAMYTRAQTMNFTNALFADNRVNFFAAYNTVMKNTAIVAVSGNHVPEEYKFLYEITGARIYDGPMDIRDIDFINFEDKVYGSKTITPWAFRSIGASERFGNVAQRIRFYPEPQRKIYFEGVNEKNLGSVEGANLLDLDGSLTGSPNSVLVPKHPFNNHESCRELADKSARAMVCKYRVGLVYLQQAGIGTTAFEASRSDGVAAKVSNFMNRVNMIYGGAYEYDIYWNDGLDLKKTALVFKTGNKFDISPVVAIHNLPGSFCKPVQGGRAVASINELRSLQETGYFTTKDTLYVKNRAEGNEGYVTGVSEAEIGRGVMGKIVCQ